MATKEHQTYFIKVISLFASVRLYNVLLVGLAQLLAACFIIAQDLPVKEVVTDYKLWLLIFASASAISGGYIMNNFYDKEKDLINRPQKTLLENQVSRSTLWSVYGSLNLLALLLGWLVSWRAGLFFLIYIVGMWLYSHKIKPVLILGNLVAALLSIAPFFVLFMYYQNYIPVVFLHGVVLFLLLGMRELIKDLENLRGDLAQNYRTIPVVWGEGASKSLYTLFTFITIAPVILLMLYYDIGKMDYYFVFMAGALLVCLPLLWSSRRKREYLLIHFILKSLIAIGVFSVLLIDFAAIWQRIIH